MTTKTKFEPTTGLVLHTPDVLRDIVFGDALEEVELPREIESPKIMPDYQNGIGKCVLESYSYLAKLQDLKETGQEHELSADFGYIVAKLVYDKNTGYGTSLETGGKVAVNYGFPEEKYFPDDENEYYKDDQSKYFRLDRIDQMAYDNAKVHSKQSFIRGEGYDWGGVNLSEIQQFAFQREGTVIAIRGKNSSFVQSNGFPLPPDLNSPEAIWYHAIVITKNWKYFNNKLHLLFANWWQPDKAKRFNIDSRAFGWLNWEAWRPHIWGCYSTIDRPNTDFIKTLMYKLVQHPEKPGSIYAIDNGAKRHIANWQTLVLGSQVPDRLWALIGESGAEWVGNIPVATPTEWALPLQSEIHLDPADE